MSRAKDLIEQLIPVNEAEDAAILESMRPLVRLAYIMEARDAIQKHVDRAAKDAHADLARPRELDYVEQDDDPVAVAPPKDPTLSRLGDRSHGATRPAEETHALVDANLRLAYSIANEYANTNASRDEIATMALAALDRAARYFDPEKGQHFGAYAGRIIRNELNRFFKEEHDYRTHEFTDLDAPVHDEEGESAETGKDRVPDPFDMDVAVDRKEELAALKKALKHVKVRPEELRAFNLHYNQGMNYRDIGKEVGTSHVNAAHWAHKVMRELRREFRNRGFDVPPDEKINPKTGRPNAIKTR